MQSSEPATSSDAAVAPSNRSSWFSDLRSKLTQLSAVDFFANLGFAHRQNNLSAASRKSSVRGKAAGQVSCSVMDLSSHADASSPVKTNQNMLLIDDAIAGSRHHSDEPRRRLFARTNEETGEVVFRRKQRSEPPVGQSPGDGANADESPNSMDDGQCIGNGHCDTLHFGTLTGLVLAGKPDPGVGHTFDFAPGGYPTWCDKCGDFISGLNERQAVRCKNCRFTCHSACQQLVTLDCRSSTDSLKSDAAPTTLVDKETPDDARGDEEKCHAVAGDYETRAEELNESPNEAVGSIVDDALISAQRDLPRGDQLRSLIEEYNNLCGDGLSMTLEEDDGATFRGFVQIHMNFCRPINVVSGEHPLTIYDVLGAENEPEEHQLPAEGRKTITSFYLPRNTVKVLHVTSETTAFQMVVSLLRKFKVADNPQKFALYERDLAPGQTLQARLVRIPEDACPLRLALLGAWQRRKVRFVLQENETGDIMWDAFEIPELQNFLKILDIEEHQYIKQIEHRYYVYRYWLDAEIRHRLATS